MGCRPKSEEPKLLSITDLVVLPQRYTRAAIAQVPAKVFTAMAMEKPIIATKISDLPEILYGCGILVRTGNIQEIAEKITFILENEDIATELGKRARKRCIEKYSISAVRKIFQEKILRNLEH